MSLLFESTCPVSIDSIGAVIVNEDDAYVYTVDGWTLDHTFSALSCGNTNSNNPASTVVVNKDKNFFAVNGSSGAGAYDLDTGAQLWFHSGWTSPVALSPDGDTLIAGNNSNLYPVDTTAWTEGTAIPTFSDVGIYPHAAFSNDGTQMAVVGVAGVTNKYRTSDWAKLGSSFSANVGWITAVEYSPDDSLMVITGTDNTATYEMAVLNVNGTGAFTHKWGVTDGIDRFGAGFFSDSVLAAIKESVYFRDGGFVTYNASSGSVIDTSDEFSPPALGNLKGMAINNQKDAALITIQATGTLAIVADGITDYVEEADSNFAASTVTYAMSYY